MKPASERQRFLIFIITGGVAALTNMGARLLFQLTVSYPWAVGLAYLVGMVTAFVLARVFVFESDDGSVRGQLSRFAIVNTVAFAQVWLISVGLADYLFPAIGFAWHAETVAHGIGVASPVVTSYLLHKNFSFRQARR